MFDQIFLLPQLKRSVITNNRYGIYEFPHELLNDLRLRILGISEISGKSQNFVKLLAIAQSSSQSENFFSPSKKLLKNRK